MTPKTYGELLEIVNEATGHADKANTCLRGIEHDGTNNFYQRAFQLRCNSGTVFADLLHLMMELQDAIQTDIVSSEQPIKASESSHPVAS